MQVNSQKGALTVFLSIILAITVFLAGTIVEAARIRVATTQATRALMNAKNSLLAGYDFRLKDEYGLFAIYDFKNVDLEGTIEYFMRTSLRPHEKVDGSGVARAIGDYWNLFDYNIDALQVSPQHNLNDYLVIQRQILEFMKYRAPIRVIDRVTKGEITDKLSVLTGFLGKPQDEVVSKTPKDPFSEKLSSLSVVGASTETLKMKTELDRQLMQLHELLVELRNRIEIINSLSKSGFRAQVDAAYSESSAFVGLLNWADDEEKRLNEAIQRIGQEMRNLSPDDQDARKALSEQLQDLQRQLSELSITVDNARQHLMNSVREIEQIVNTLLRANMEAAAIIPRVLNSIRKFSVEVTRFGEHLETNKDTLELVHDDMYDKMYKAYQNYKAISVIGLTELNAPLAENTAVLQECRIYLRNIWDAVNAMPNNTFEGRSANLLTVEREASNIKTASDDYRNNLRNALVDGPELPPTEPPPPDPRDMAKEVEAAIDSVLQQVKGEDIPLEVFKSLPSKHEHTTNDIAKAELGTIEFDENAETGFLDRTLANAGDIFGRIPGLPSDFNELRDSLFIAEYVAGNFKSRITDTKKIHNVNLRGKPKSERESHLEFEMEYILYGDREDIINLGFAVASISAIRFASNFAFVSINLKYITKAKVIAAAAAAKSTVGAPLVKPIVKALVLAAFAMKYTKLDIQKLLAGKEVPIFRGKPNLTMNYEEYLYSFLLISLNNPQTELMRINDLIQINMQSEDVAKRKFDMIDFYTYLDTEAKVSIENIFINIVDQTEEVGIINRARHSFEVIVMDGY